MREKIREATRKVAAVLRSHDGPLTQELIRRPGQFGLGQVPERLAPESVASGVCGFCSTGCGLHAHLRGGEARNLSPDGRYPVNRGMACPKGWEALVPLDAPDRATQPLLRNAAGQLEPVSWERAMQAFVEGIRGVQDRLEPEAAAFLGTGQMPTEELAFFGSLAKFGMGMADGDGNTRQCMATAVEAYKQSFGFDAPPYTYADFEESDVIVLVGANLCIAHPILWERICRNPRNPSIIVIDPRRTETAVAASQHLAIEPKSDLALFYGIAQALIEGDAVDTAFIEGSTQGFEAFRDFVGDYSLVRAAEETKLDLGEIQRFAETIADATRSGRRVSFWWTMGVNQCHEGVRVAQSLINLALMTGQIGKPGTGANSITGQCNAMGSRLFSNTTNLLGGRDFTNSEDREAVAEILSIPVEAIPTRKSLAYDEILESVRAGRIKALWIVATNPAHSWIDQGSFHALREQLDFLVVQDMYASTETAQMADLVLPAAGWGEKEGTFINSERRIGRIRKVRRAPGQALADFQIFRLVAEAWGCSAFFERWKSPEDVFASMKALSAGRPCDFSGIEGYAMLAEQGGLQWPFSAEMAELALADAGEAAEELLNVPPSPPPSAWQQRRLFESGHFYHPDGRARFCFEASRDPLEPVSEAYPFVLLTGRGSSAQWHTGTRTNKSPVLRRLAPSETYVEIHPEDAARLGIEDGRSVEIASIRGAVRVHARVTRIVAPGQLFLPMHDAATNVLTFASFDPYSHQPSYKHSAVSIRPV